MNFNEIPINIKTPGSYIEFDNSNANKGLPAMPHKILVIGQRLGSRSAAAGEIKAITNDHHAESFFGRGSMLAEMLKALRAVNSYTECYAISIDENSAGTAASGTITYACRSVRAGTLNLYIASKKLTIGVTTQMRPTEVATATVAAITAQTDLPVTATSVAGVVTLTAKWKGETGNDIDIRFNYYADEDTPKGLSYTVVQMNGGTGNPDISATIASMGDTQYHTVVMPFTDSTSMSMLESELSDRWGPMIMKEGHAFAAINGTHSAITTIANGRNCPHITTMGAGKSPTPSYIVAAVVAGIDAFEPDPARPRQTLKMRGVLPPAESDRFTRSERNLHLADGVSTCVTDAGGNVLIERLVTNYTTNASGLPDESYLDVTTMRTLAYLRYSLRARIAQKYPRHKLADDGTKFSAGQAIVTPATLRAEILALFIKWEESGLVEGREQFKADLIVERDRTDQNRINAILPPDVINQLRVLAGQIQFRL